MEHGRANASPCFGSIPCIPTLYILTTFCNFLIILQCSASSHESASAVPSCISEAETSYTYST